MTQARRHNAYWLSVEAVAIEHDQWHKEQRRIHWLTLRCSEAARQAKMEQRERLNQWRKGELTA